MSKNLELWTLVEKTDPDYTTSVSKGNYHYTAIDSYYLVKKATEMFGPIGIGWGYDVIEERFDEGAPIAYPEAKDGSPLRPVFAVMHTARVKLWYRWKDDLATVEHYGHTEFISATKYGPRTDTEAPKKSITDALKKCLSMVGMASDVFMGQFDDQLYVEERREAAALEKADNKAEMLEKQKADFRDWVERHRNLIATAVNLNELETVYKICIRKLQSRNEAELAKEFTLLKDKRKQQLQKAEDNKKRSTRKSQEKSQ